jgi:hypothetical protein
MKVNIVKDSSGKVVGAFEKASSSGAHVAPQLKPGQTVDEVDAQNDYKQNLKAFYQQHSKRQSR